MRSASRSGPGRLGSIVHRGVHRALGHPVAIRMLRSVTERDEAARARFLHEARSLQVAHPSIIQVRDYGEEGDLVYVVTDFIEGPEHAPAADRVRPAAVAAAVALRRRSCSKRRTCCTATRACCAACRPDIVRVAVDENSERLMISSAGIWDAQDLLGTLQEQTLRGMALADSELRYVAPELFTGRTADIRSDVFTLGVLIYEMATGVLPFDGSTLPELLGKMLTGTVRDPRELQPSLPEPAGTSIQKALSSAPEKRFDSAREFLAAFAATGGFRRYSD